MFPHTECNPDNINEDQPIDTCADADVNDGDLEPVVIKQLNEQKLAKMLVSIPSGLSQAQLIEVHLI